MHNTGRKQALTMMRLASHKTINIEGEAGNYHVTSSWKNESTSTTTEVQDLKCRCFKAVRLQVYIYEVVYRNKKIQIKMYKLPTEEDEMMFLKCH